MHILLTDVLSCPRCGPRFGLVVLADRMEGRRVAQGSLGCPNCREQYPVRGGVAELRPDPATAAPPAEGVTGEDRAFRTAALLGASDASGMMLVVGGAPALVGEVSRLLPTMEVIGAGDPAGGPPPDASWIVPAPRALPFRDRSLFGVALLGREGGELLREGARVLRPGARLVVDPAPPGAAAELEKIGLRPLLDQEGVVVASAPGPG